MQTGREYIFEGQVQMFKKGKKHPRLAILVSPYKTLILLQNSYYYDENFQMRCSISELIHEWKNLSDS